VAITAPIGESSSTTTTATSTTIKNNDSAAASSVQYDQFADADDAPVGTTFAAELPPPNNKQLDIVGHSRSQASTQRRTASDSSGDTIHVLLKSAALVRNPSSMF
jgi:hypothetical protein